MREDIRGWLFVCGLAFAAWGCEGTEPPSYGGESHWLDACEYDSDCDDGLRCVCDTCTRDCVNDDGCGERGDALCVNAESPLLQRRCAAESLPADDGVCIARCEGDGDCPSGTTCVGAACVPVVSMPDAGDSIRDRIDMLGPIDASMSFDEPVDVPQVAEAIRGADERLIGTWKQSGCDPRETFCARLEIERNDAGGVAGTLTFEPMPNYPGWVPGSSIDPDRGFPPDLTTMDYARFLQLPNPGMAYRMLDGRFEGTRLRFFWSPVDLWQDWCALQTPYRWQDGDRSAYQCVPQALEALSTIDPKKVVLCRNPRIRTGLPPCEEPSQFCRCDPGISTDCPQPVCRCDGQACEADVSLYPIRVDLSLEDDRLVGDFREEASALPKGVDTFERVSP